MNQQQQQQIEETMDVISAMCRQEASYATCDYLSQHALNEQSLDVDMESRSLMVEWCYRVVSFTQMNNETVAIAMNILDRFMASSAAGPILADRRSYQLAAMTALYTMANSGIHFQRWMFQNLSSKLHKLWTRPIQRNFFYSLVLSTL